MLRNPVDRAYSHYHMSVGGRHERLSFEEAVRKEGARLRAKQDRSDPYLSKAYRHYSYVARGIYVDQLKAYEAFSSRGQLLVVKSEDLFEKTQETYDEILRFLELAPWRLQSTGSVNTGSYSREKPPGYEELCEFYAPHNQRLYDYLGRDLGW